MTQSNEPSPADAELTKSAAQALLGKFHPDAALPYDTTIQKALFVARALQQRAHELQTPAERKQQMELDRMLQNHGDKAILTQLTDQAFRSEEASRAADQLIHILDVQGVPRFFTPLERTLLRGFQSFGSALPGVAVPLVKDRMRRETANVILPAAEQILREHLGARRSEGVRMNVNFLGEAILGEDEAKRRLERYLEALQIPEIEVVSIKISTIYSQIRPIDREHTIRAISDRMELLYRAARNATFQRADGSVVPKFVYLDMEEYRDMSLTADVFMRTLDRSGLRDVSAGIALQAYIPDSYAMQKRITDWARNRVQQGGAAVTIRIVKGANMEMERVDAALADWPQAPFQTKLDTDANYKRMVRFALDPAHRRAVKPGIASHNLFDISYALVSAIEQDALPDLQFEMLEGMANHQRRALHELTRNLLLYAPACQKEDFINAIGYLVRRLDENTGEENFLRHAFNITVDSPAWTKLADGFLRSFERIPDLSEQPRRTQDRRTESYQTEEGHSDWQAFQNEPDTDFSLIPNSEWAASIIQRWQPRCGDDALDIPLVISAKTVADPRPEMVCLDPSRPGVVVGRYRQASASDAFSAVATAKADLDGWRSRSSAQRQQVLRRVATELRRARGDLMGAALADGGKVLTESDAEVSEAIDFVEFYSATASGFSDLTGVSAHGRGVVVVVSPWNFPIAIPCGGISAALAAGNTVILKPASDTVLVAHLLCECFYTAGVPRTALQLVPCARSTVGQQLVSHHDVDTVILTGGTATALNMLRHRPALRLLAETGGKNATIVTALSDRELAIKHVIHSAFSHCGQKCSATSLLLLEDEVFEDEDFKAALIDAVKSVDVGSAWQLHHRLGPLIRPPAGDLERGLKDLEAGESWALLPEPLADNPGLYSPGIKWNVQPHSYTHQTEFFGPVLGVMRFRTLREAIEIVNATGYGLTSGLESLDDREQATWTESVRAGNLYINRPTTGAIVLRQPFGGIGKSALGPGIKAGGPNYVAQLMQYTATGNPSRDGSIEQPQLKEFARKIDAVADTSAAHIRRDQADGLRRAIESYDYHARTEFCVAHDHFQLIGQDNYRRYIPVEALCIRVHPDDSLVDVFCRAAAARAAGCRMIVSWTEPTPPDAVDLLHDMTEAWAGDIEFIEQTDQQLITAIQAGEVGRLRYADPSRVPETVREAVIGKFIFVADARVLDEGRLELLWYVQEQSISIDYHRYGNLGARSGETRAPTR